MFHRRDPRAEWLRTLAHMRPGQFYHSRAVPSRRSRKTVLLLALPVMLVGPVVEMRWGEPTSPKSEAWHAAACPDASVVWEGTTTGTLETDLFEVSAQQFVVTHEMLDLEVGDGVGPFLVSVEDEQGRTVSSSPAPVPTPGGPLMEDHHLKPNEGRYVVEAPPGAYKVSVDPGGWAKRYTVTVEECGVPEVS